MLGMRKKSGKKKGCKQIRAGERNFVVVKSNRKVSNLKTKTKNSSNKQHKRNPSFVLGIQNLILTPKLHCKQWSFFDRQLSNFTEMGKVHTIYQTLGPACSYTEPFLKSTNCNQLRNYNGKNNTHNSRT